MRAVPAEVHTHKDFSRDSPHGRPVFLPILLFRNKKEFLHSKQYHTKQHQ